ncbi:flavin-binding monooxygenase-like protein [Stackebrandtia albiflava]|uniref:Flavin-binding monooxygenase-like protein n=1 Tax=Stackebrandtia albiflava TaxID=406432 RepID=A0A562VGZ6_9ACTN|nr:NAD(P)-binding domain-containing protein [Stackebrandtia albiflava]TWJ17104.1 flavin-binding monooxygenase-like protein [Stackebrandtia albiflava]
MSEYGVDAAYDRGDAVCVIGAGASGLLAVKNLREHGFKVDCYERDTGIGGGWNIRQRNSPMYANAHLISSRPLTEFPDFPMPDDWPDYPHHSKVLAYLERYADHFGLREHIWFGSEIERIEPVEHGRFDVVIRSASSGSAGRRLRYAAVVIANGHNWDPFMPEYPGQQAFRGQILHSVSYQDSTRFRDRKVLVVGGGNSGCDIACEAAVSADTCWHSTRRGYWYTPKYLFGRPADQVDAGLSWLPAGLKRRLTEFTLRRVVGDPTRFGLPAPDHRFKQAHPIVNGHVLHHIGHGAIVPKPDVARFDGRSVVFTDGTTAEPDLVIMATGYRPRFDFCDPELLGVNRDTDGFPKLFAQLFSPASETLFVAGLLQSDSGIFPLVHWQTVAIAKWLRVRASDPERAKEFRGQVITESEGGYAAPGMVDSPRHRLEVSGDRYAASIGRIIQTLDNGSEAK